MSVHVKKYALRVLLTLAVVGPGTVAASAAGARAAEPDSAPAVENGADAAEPKDEQRDPFKVPDGTPEELLAYVDGLRNEKPAGQDYESIRAFRVQVAEAISQATSKVLVAKEATPEQAIGAVRLKINALEILTRLDQEDAEKSLRDLPEELRKAGRAEMARTVETALLERDLQSAMGDEDEIGRALDRIEKYLTGAPIDAEQTELALSAGRLIEEAGYEELAVKSYQRLAKAMQASKNEEASSAAAWMQGASRRLTLIGQPMHLEGTTYDGQAFKWADYRGKMVLVDFWATWCGPCRQLIPQLQDLRERYGERGFDIVGVNLDEEPESLKSFLEETEMPWTNIVDEVAKDSQKKMDRYYGIYGIPTTMLVDKEGKVVAMNLRGEELEKALQQHLGPAETVEEEPKSDEEK